MWIACWTATSIPHSQLFVVATQRDSGAEDGCGPYLEPSKMNPLSRRSSHRGRRGVAFTTLKYAQ